MKLQNMLFAIFRGMTLTVRREAADLSRLAQVGGGELQLLGARRDH